MSRTLEDERLYYIELNREVVVFLHSADQGVDYHTHLNKEAEFMVYSWINETNLVTLGRNCLSRGSSLQAVNI